MIDIMVVSTYKLGGQVMSWQDNMQQWLDYKDLDPDMKEQLNEMKNDDKVAEEAFYEPMEFGTAGMRGLIGPGINRMNIYTVRQAAEGLASFMDTLDDKLKSQGVAISYDSRYYSQDFAYESAKFWEPMEFTVMCLIV